MGSRRLSRHTISNVNTVIFSFVSFSKYISEIFNMSKIASTRRKSFKSPKVSNRISDSHYEFKFNIHTKRHKLLV